MRLRNVNCIKLFVVKINSIFVMSFAHFTKQRFPVDGHTEIIYHSFDLFWKPSFQAQKMNIFDCSWALAWSNKWIGSFSRFKANSTYMFIFLMFDFYSRFFAQSTRWLYIGKDRLAFYLFFFLLWLLSWNFFFFVMKIIIDWFSDSNVIIGHNYWLVKVSWYNFSNSHFLFTEFDDIPFFDRVFLKLQLLYLFRQASNYQPKRPLDETFFFLICYGNQLVEIISSNKSKNGILHLLHETIVT